MNWRESIGESPDGREVPIWILLNEAGDPSACLWEDSEAGFGPYGYQLYTPAMTICWALAADLDTAKLEVETHFVGLLH